MFDFSTLCFTLCSALSSAKMSKLLANYTLFLKTTKLQHCCTPNWMNSLHVIIPDTSSSLNWNDTYQLLKCHRIAQKPSKQQNLVFSHIIINNHNFNFSLQSSASGTMYMIILRFVRNDKQCSIQHLFIVVVALLIKEMGCFVGGANLSSFP